jgi:hypothetical protein
MVVHLCKRVREVTDGTMRINARLQAVTVQKDACAYEGDLHLLLGDSYTWLLQSGEKHSCPKDLNINLSNFFTSDEEIYGCESNLKEASSARSWRITQDPHLNSVITPPMRRKPRKTLWKRFVGWLKNLFNSLFN